MYSTTYFELQKSLKDVGLNVTKCSYFTWYFSSTYLFAFKRVYGSLSLDFYNHILNSYWVFKKFYSALYHTKKLLSLYNFEIE